MEMGRDKVFISYSHQDHRHLQRLRVHLRPVVRERKMEIWDDTRIGVGTEWRVEIANAIENAKVAVLLISADFLASDFIVANELPPILNAQKNDGLHIICVLIGPSRFESIPDLSKFQAINPPSRSILSISSAEREKVWVKVANAVDAAFQNRDPEEGWLVRNENRLFEGLRRIVESPTKGAFLVASVGDFYVQFAKEFDRTALLFEAVANEHLPKKFGVQEKQLALLSKLGFAAPDSESCNHHQTIHVTNIELDLRRVARIAITVFTEVFCVGQTVNVDISGDMGDGDSIEDLG